MSSGKVGSKHQFSNDGRTEEDNADSSNFNLEGTVEQDRSVGRILSLGS